MAAEAGEPVAEPRVVVNGRTRPLGEVGGHVTLLEWLRGRGLTGCKEGCAEGECGACAVLVARDAGPGDGHGRTCWVAINACLVPAAAFDRQEVVTAEGLGRPGRLHPVQREMAERGGSQCGYCTPGFVCSMAAEYYRPGRLSQPPAEPEVNGQYIPNGQGGAADDEHGANGFDLHALSGNLCRCTGYRPIRDAAEALALLAAEPDARLVAGSTDWGIELNIRHARAPLTIGIDRFAELREFSAGRRTIDIGAALSLSEIEARLAGRLPLLAEMFPQFASRLIRNGATLGGNLGTASPIGDAPPALLALDASLVLASSQGEREVRLAEYFTGYRRSVKRPDELITTIRIPLPAAPVTAFHKIAKRRFDDISSVAVAYALRLDDDGRVASIRIGLGGVAATPLRALAAEEALAGQPWTRPAVAAAAEELARAGTPMSDHRASEAYRIAMLRNSMLKFYAEQEDRA